MESWREEFYASDYGSEYLAHHGIKGQRWGIRRYQNPDGTLTSAGRARYLKYLDWSAKKEARTSSEWNKLKLASVALKNPIIKDFSKNVGMDEVNKRLEEERLAAFNKSQKVFDGDPEKFDEKKADKALAEYDKELTRIRKAYQEIGKEKVKDYLGSIYDDTVAKSGVNYERAENLINSYMGFESDDTINARSSQSYHKKSKGD